MCGSTQRLKKIGIQALHPISLYYAKKTKEYKEKEEKVACGGACLHHAHLLWNFNLGPYVFTQYSHLFKAK